MKLKRIILVFFLLLASITLFADGRNCFTVVVGKEVSAKGCILVAHNEDDAGKNFFVNTHKIPSHIHQSRDTVILKNNAVLRQAPYTRGYLWLHIPGIDFGDSFLTEKGVVIASNACRSREDLPHLFEGGIGFKLRHLMAERADSAKHAVKIAGKLIEKYGYYSSGRSYVVADAGEAWIMQVVKGKHWVAKRVRDHQVAVISNCYTIGTVDLKDKRNYLGSADLINYAVKRGWYKPERDGKFHFARIYGAPEDLKSEENVLRRWRGIDLLSKKKYKPGEAFEFAFSPGKQIRLQELFKVLRDHYEDTEYDLTDDYKEGSPNSTKKRTICTESTRYSFVAELRKDYPREIANCIWISFRRPDSNAFAPWYSSIETQPLGYVRGDSRIALENHFLLPEEFYKFHPDYAYWYFDRLSILVDGNYKVRIKPVRKKWKNFEDYAIKRMRKMEKEFAYMLKINKKIALKIITNYVHKLEYRKWFLAEELIEQIEK